MTVRIDRLQKLSDHLKSGNLGHTKFNFSVVSDSLGGRRKPNGCGTLGCAMGELPILFPNEWRFDLQGLGGYHAVVRLRRSSADGGMSEDVAAFFDITSSAAGHLFYPGDQLPELFGGKVLDNTAAPSEVADNIDAFCTKLDV